MQYKSFLVRLWQESDRGPWRASLQSTATKQTLMFADIQFLFAFLESETSETDNEMQSSSVAQNDGDE